MEPDIEKAKLLLAEAGYADGLELVIDLGNTNGPWQQQVCEILKEQLAPAGITLNLNLMPASKYWETWQTAPFGFTAWTHRPLGTMVLSLAYRSGVPWNETAYNNPEFEKALDNAEALVDAEKRKDAMKIVEEILQEDAIIIQPVWQPKMFLANDKVKGLKAHPTQYHQFYKVWIDS
jgi:peptide/nickel transport system substrate-binding protein